MQNQRQHSNVLLLLIAILLGPISPEIVVAQSGESDIESYRAESVEVNRLVGKGDLKQAQKKSVELISTATRLFGAADRETGIAAKNAGEIARVRGDHSDAIKYLSQALEIFQKSDQDGSNSGMIAKTANSLGFVLAKKDKEDESARMYELAYRKGIEAFGEDSREIIPIIKAYAMFKVFKGELEAADEQFARLYTLTKSLYPGDESRLEELDNDYTCSVGMSIPFALAGGATKYSEAKKGSEVGSGPDRKIVDRGVVNGAALRLANPEPSTSALRAAPRGSQVAVKLVIGKEGNVTSAKAICGPKLLWSASEEAALRSRFKPTMLDGEAIEVSGVIVYNYF